MKLLIVILAVFFMSCATLTLFDEQVPDKPISYNGMVKLPTGEIMNREDVRCGDCSHSAGCRFLVSSDKACDYRCRKDRITEEYEWKEIGCFLRGEGLF
jgi:hypothetical protein